jgi:GYF domain 2
MNTNSTEPDSTRWYCVQDGQTVGPLPFSSIQTLARTGQLPPDVLVVREGSLEWQRFSDVVAKSSQRASVTSHLAALLKIIKSHPRMALLIGLSAMLPFREKYGEWLGDAIYDSAINASNEESKRIDKLVRSADEVIKRSKVRTDSEPNNPPKRKAWIIEGGHDGGIDFENGVVHWLGGLVECLNDGSISESSASACYYESGACMCNVVNVLDSFVICQAHGIEARRFVEFAIRRKDVEANVTLPATLQSLAYYHGDLHFTGYAHFIERSEFRTSSGVVKSVPVFEIVKDVN